MNTDTRLSGAGQRLSGATSTFGAASVRTELFTSLRSALDGFSARAGFDQQIVRQLLSTD